MINRGEYIRYAFSQSCLKVASFSYRGSVTLRSVDCRGYPVCFSIRRVHMSLSVNLTETVLPSATIAILAGGQSNRMGTDKSFVMLHGKPVFEHVLTHVQALA